MTFTSQYIEYLLDENGIATVTLNRPDKHNAFNDIFISDMITIFNQLNSHDQVRVIILQAKGENFCAGADIHWMKKMADFTLEQNHQDAKSLALMMKTIYNMAKPVICLVQGASYGGGLGIICCCDIVIASENATFCFSEAKIGLSPSVISPYVINAIGTRQAHRYFLTAEKFDATVAKSINLIHEVVLPEQLISAGNQLASHILKNGPLALKNSKALLSIASKHILNEQTIAHTITNIANIRITAEAQEGLSAFLQKRLPSWYSEI